MDLKVVSIFKDVVERDVMAHLTAGMTSKLWLQVPTSSVKINELIATQPGVFDDESISTETPFGGDPYPHVVACGQNLFLEDGHHRCVRAHLVGQEWITTRVLVFPWRKNGEV